ncbi:hypothetical protein [Flavobacterium weaverense]|uniref:Uncharacterized protein n=1 Tax=Flavobacterium weaverense TaxID=271156 RepID=A0A3L9ZQ16_9FLAO|nr:hypothetical protein [Flavobacterium weaverense]RMA74893.1 hypothetical protein BC961_2229 [Flavobacterium weaverense]
MKYISLKTNKKSIVNGLLLFVFLLLTNTSAFAQTSNDIAVDNDIENSSSVKTQSTSAVSTSNSVNFVLWFMGTKQDPNSTISVEGTNTKKQVITSGMAPNRLLIKAFLKKAVDLDTMIA